MNGNSEHTFTIKDKELPEYIIVPYQGKLKNNVPASEKPADAHLVFTNWKTGARKSLPVNVDSHKKRIYMEERNFNCHWKTIREGIFREKQDRAFREKTAAPSYSDIGNLVDLSLYENERRRAVLQKDQIKIIGKPLSEEEKILQSKRNSAMDNRKIRYVFSNADRIVHDKACPLVKKIGNRDFRASEDLPEGRSLCLVCTKMMYIRKGCKDDFKNYGLYQQFFKRGHVGVKEIGRLVNEYNAAIRMENKNTMCIKCGEDQWKLILKPDRGVTLLHNNYVMINEEERYISSGFHDQKLQTGCSATGALHCIEGYTWEGHLTARAARQAEEREEQRLQAARPQRRTYADSEGKHPVRTWLFKLYERIKGYFA